MNEFNELKVKLQTNPKRWLVTGVAGFIGSNLLESLLKLGQKVVGIDNFSTGYKQNLLEVEKLVSSEQWSNFKFIEGDICNLDACKEACSSVDYILHQAALGSVPRSIADPITSNKNNVDGFLNMLVAAKDAGIKSFVYAASSSTYGDHPDLPKVEDKIGSPLSPYAVTKLVNEIYADVFSKNYEFRSIGLRYFNVFGPRQDPDGAYAAVIPKWISAMIRGSDVNIFGDGLNSRDFCYIDNVVQANMLAATAEREEVWNQVYNVANGDRISLNELYDYLSANLTQAIPELKLLSPVYKDFRGGDVRHSLANINKISLFLKYSPSHDIYSGLNESIDWYVEKLR